MQTWKDTFGKSKLAGWEQLDAVLPDVMPYYPRRPVNRADWQVKDGCLAVESKESAWSYLLRGEAGDTDYTLRFDMLVPAMTPDRTEYFGDMLLSHRPGEFEPCWETAAIVRYVDSDHFYRIAFGMLAGEPGAVALWSPQGGFLQVVPYQGRPFAWRKVKVVCARDVVEVWLDGELAIHYRDTVAPNLKGRCGIGAAGKQFYRFRNVRRGRNRGVLPAGKATRPGVGRKRFRLQKFLRQDFLFCNNEPIACIAHDTPWLREVVLRPGYQPMLKFGLQWDQQGADPDSFVNTNELWVVEKTDGPQFVLRYRNRNHSGSARCSGRLTVGYDAKRGSYTWDVDTTVEVAKGRTWTNSDVGLQYAHPHPYHCLPPSVEMPDPWPCLYQWVVFDGADGKVWRHPLLHKHVPPIEKQMRVNSRGGRIVMMHNPHANLAVELDFDPKRNPQAGWWLCPWMYEIHCLFNPYKMNEAIPAGTKHRVKFRYVSMHGPTADRMLDASEVHPYFRSLPARMEYTAGVNTFDALTPMDAPHRGYVWDGGTWDPEVGHDKAGSLRLDGAGPGKPARAEVVIGGSSFMGRFDAPRYRVTGWVKTEKVRGKGAALVVRAGDAIARSQQVKGTTGWQRLTLETELLYGAGSVPVGLELDGPGTAWLDDFQIEPIGR